MLYALYELNQAALAPLRETAKLSASGLASPMSPVGHTAFARNVAAMTDMFAQATRRRAKPQWRLDQTTVNGETVRVEPKPVMRLPFCRLLHFVRDPKGLEAARPGASADPKVLIVAPMSGHYATLLRGTVAAMLPDHDVYITDWTNARDVPVAFGRFDLDDYVDYLQRFIRHIGGRPNVMGVCQPGPAVLMAASIMAEDEDPNRPSSIIVMGSPIDARKSPTAPNVLAAEREIDWFQENLIQMVPPPYPGWLRQVYPGFIQLQSFIAMNVDRHVDAHWRYFEHLVEGDKDSADKHEEFYDEYLAVMDLTAEFYIQTVHEVFQEYLLPRGEKTWRGRPVNPQAIRDIGVMTVEGEKDDISGIGQTQAAHDLCVNVPAHMQRDYIQQGVGHYGVFNGRRWREEIQPRIAEFIRSIGEGSARPKTKKAA